MDQIVIHRISLLFGDLEVLAGFRGFYSVFTLPMQQGFMLCTPNRYLSG